MSQFTVTSDMEKRIKEKLGFIYGYEKAPVIYKEMVGLINRFPGSSFNNPNKTWIDETDAMLITYGDQIKEEGKPNLVSLHELLKEKVDGVVSAVHILPFYPYSSDDGFSVIDYFKVNPELGDWGHVEEIAKDFEIMFDGVINHISAGSDWFQSYLKGEDNYKTYFIEADPNADYSAVTRPRALPLLSTFETANGVKHIWSTFSADQIDLNYENEEVFLKILELLLFYSQKGAKLLRLDAIGYMWKRLGTSCIHLEEVHKIIQVYRDVFEVVAPQTIIITETNVPHKDNISYFGDGTNEAHMVYNFPLPPLTLHSLHTGDASTLLKWANSLEKISDQATFFNFLASHDGIGVQPAKGILTDEQVTSMAEKVKENGGHVSYKANGDGTQSPYELNINFLEAISHPNDEQSLKVKRFMASQSVLLTLMGMPGIYVHSLFGSMNDHEGVKQTGRYRSINREKLNRQKLEQELNEVGTLRNEVFTAYKKFLKIRRTLKAFHPNADQYVLFLNDHVYSIKRVSLEGEETVVALTNFSNNPQTVKINRNEWSETVTSVVDVITDETVDLDMELFIELNPYEVKWLKGK